MEDQGKQDEEKLEFTPEGEALVYISLDQARVRAIEHARDNREFYGPRYASRDLAWEELSAEESEDYYRIQLSYPPNRHLSRRVWPCLGAVNSSGLLGCVAAVYH